MNYQLLSRLDKNVKKQANQNRDSFLHRLSQLKCFHRESFSHVHGLGASLQVGESTPIQLPRFISYVIFHAIELINTPSHALSPMQHGKVSQSDIEVTKGAITELQRETQLINLVPAPTIILTFEITHLAQAYPMQFTNAETLCLILGSVLEQILASAQEQRQTHSTAKTLMRRSGVSIAISRDNKQGVLIPCALPIEQDALGCSPYYFNATFIPTDVLRSYTFAGLGKWLDTDATRGRVEITDSGTLSLVAARLAPVVEGLSDKAALYAMLFLFRSDRDALKQGCPDRHHIQHIVKPIERLINEKISRNSQLTHVDVGELSTAHPLIQYWLDRIEKMPPLAFFEAIEQPTDHAASKWVFTH